MKVALIFALACVGYASCCVTSSDCTADQCCLRQDIMIMSKRQLGLIGPLSGLAKCIPRAAAGEQCGSFSSCGCQAGLLCEHLNQPLINPLVKRIVMMLPGVCVVDTTV